MSIAEKLIKIAENEPKVYEAGKVSQIQGVEPAEVDASLFGGKLKTIAENTIRVFEKGRADANLQKATASGEVVRVDDVSPIEHKLKVNLTSDALTDFSGVGVTRYGKNLLGITEVTEHRAEYEVTFENGVIGTKYGDSNSFACYTNKVYLPTNTPLCYRHRVIGGDRVIIRCFDENDNNISANISIGWGSYLAGYQGHFGAAANGAKFTLPSEVSYVILGYCVMQNTAQQRNEYSEMQIEIGNVATSYEQYKEPQTAFALAGGTVNGLTSLSPTMTLIPDTEGVSINLEYYKQS